MTENNAAWLTQEAYDRLQAELEHLEGPGRTEIAERIAAARDEGDLKENGGYHAAREEQGKLEARIGELRALLRDATVGEAPKDDGTVESGMVVTIDLAGKQRRFLLGNREIAEDDETLDVFSAQSPLGQAIDGSSVGDSVAFTSPTGKTVTVKILEATPYSSAS